MTPIMTPKTRNLLLLLAALGLGASAWSSYVHYQLLTRPGYSSFCDVNSTVSCTQAYLSQYGSLWGVPVALGGVLYFTIVLLLAGIGGRRPTPAARDSVPAYIFALSTFALAFVLYLAWASFFRLNAVCLLCAVTYVAVIGIFLVSGGATSLPMTTLPKRATEDAVVLIKSPVALVAAIACSVGFVSLVSAFPRETHAPQAAAVQRPQYPPLTDQQKADFFRWIEVQPKIDVPVDAGGAKVVIVKFNDYQCPACRETYFAYKPIIDKYAAGGQVKYITKHYPLEGECNPNAPGGSHRSACESAAGVLLAQRKGLADKFEQWLVTNLETMTPDGVKRGVAEIAGITDFDAQYVQVLPAIRADAELGGKLQVNSTPTFFVNGRRFVGGALSPPALDALIEYELKKAS